ncbi:PQQ-dependent sugar dehydrogenase [Pontibacter sp. G13]|uniref:PQQ-dependent sugar dehydrogenase n=1 Tax=Pontibacter sp. G13 TaxID=3074898 RepID=UPI0028899DBC|nr:PQQ-dependent sugar dehydrogenase [Pontibacter sp. G13]WNJ16644.1 PQQ-dependent sugar dehydrogenase [Pontibacter sp. G13]
MVRIIFFSQLIIWLSLAQPLMAQPDLELVTFATGLNTPVAITHAGDSRLFVVDQTGKIQIVQSDGTVNAFPFLDITSKVRYGGERGLLGLAFAPDFATSGSFYVNYTRQPDNVSVIARYQVTTGQPDIADPLSENILLTVPQPFNNHNGGDLAFGPDGYLYAAFGDGGSAGDPDDYGQNTQSYLGKILRLDVSGNGAYSIPADNPFVGATDTLAEIWSLGWRNPWRISFDRETGDMWIGDVGQGLREEISFESADFEGGGNYGWRCVEGDVIFNSSGCDSIGAYISPILAYNHSIGASVTGGYVYRGDSFPDLDGYYIFSDYVSGNFWTLFPTTPGVFDTTYQGKLLPNEQASTFGENVDGELFVAALTQGTIYRIRDLNSSPPTSIDPLTYTSAWAYPQPWIDELKVEKPSEWQGSWKVVLWNLEGQMVRQTTAIQQSSTQLSREDLPVGIYLLEARQSGQASKWQKVWIAE